MSNNFPQQAEYEMDSRVREYKSQAFVLVAICDQCAKMSRSENKSGHSTPVTSTLILWNTKLI